MSRSHNGCGVSGRTSHNVNRRLRQKDRKAEKDRKTERQKGLVEPFTFPIHRCLLSSSEFEKLTKQREIAFVNILDEYVLTLSFNLNPKIGLLSKTKNNK